MFQDYLRTQLPTDTSRQANLDYLKVLAGRCQPGWRVLDIGVGEIPSLELFQRWPQVPEWTGVDVVAYGARERIEAAGGTFVLYDGVHLPFPDCHFDVIFSRQVFEHVTDPFGLTAEIGRVLKPGGVFVGSTSQLEPYHAESVWNYTPYGFKLLMERSGLSLDEVRPSIDGLTLIVRRLLGCPAFFGRWWTRESPLNRLIGIAGRLLRKDAATVNAMKLLFCGQFCFVARKP
jgi:SAM-dependent methyltransferase